MAINIVTTIKNETASLRNRPAVTDGDKSVSYDDLLAAVDQVSAVLSSRGIKKDMRIALYISEGISYIVMSLSVLALNAVIVPIASTQTRSEADDMCVRMKVHGMIVDAESDPTDEALCFHVFTNSYVLKMLQVDMCDDQVSHQDNCAFIRFSSGTTGDSKGIVLSHKTIIERTDAANKGLCIEADDVILWGMSMAYHFVVTILLFLRRAAHIVLCTAQFPDSLLDACARHGGTFMYASPFYYQYMTASPEITKERCKDLRLAISTAMKLPLEVSIGFTEKFGIELSEAYGIIEVGLPFVNTMPSSLKRGSVGTCLPDYEIRIDTPDEKGIGKIWLRGPGMVDAYFELWRGRSEILSDGWFITGDIGYIDDDGYLFIMGRNKSMINFNGMKIFPEEVEAVINAHPAIAESVVMGIDHPMFGQVPNAKVVLKEGVASLDENALRAFCYGKLAKFKVPKTIVCVNEVEKTVSGKIKRN